MKLSLTVSPVALGICLGAALSLGVPSLWIWQSGSPLRKPLGSAPNLGSSTADSGGCCASAEPIDDLPYTIRTPGHYYVTQDLPVGVLADGNYGIEILTTGVTIDLCGFRLSGTPGSLDAIYSEEPNSQRVIVRNGTIAGWGGNAITILGGNATVQDVNAFANGGGLQLAQRSRVTGVELNNNTSFALTVGDESRIRDVLIGLDNGSGITGTDSVLVEDSIVADCEGAGIVLGNRARVYDTTSIRNLGDGIAVGGFSNLQRCTSMSNQGAAIRADLQCVISDCVTGFAQEGLICLDRSLVSNCTSTDITNEPAIDVGADSRVEHCSASNSHIGISLGARSVAVGCSANGNSSYGIVAQGIGTQVRDCIVDAGSGVGVRLLDYGLAEGNTCTGNAGAGLQVDGNGARIERNQSNLNGIGIEIIGDDNLITMNALADNGVSTVIPSSNTFGPNGLTSGYISSSNPYLNFNLTFPNPFP